MNNILSFIPKNRQNIFVSATKTPQVLDRVDEIVGSNSPITMIDTFEKWKPKTNDQVSHSYMPVSWKYHFPSLYVIILKYIKRELKLTDGSGSKIIIFLPTTTAAECYGEMLANLFSPVNLLSDEGSNKKVNASINVCFLHGKLPKDTRDRVSSQFRDFSLLGGNSIIMVTTDVSARGMDYPDIGLVIQVGIPVDSSQYLHRIGRTGRAGKKGECLILISPFETKFLSAANSYIGGPDGVRSNPEYNSKFAMTLSRALDYSYRNISNNCESPTYSSKTTQTGTNDATVSLFKELAGYMNDYVRLFEIGRSKVGTNTVHSAYTSLLNYYLPLSKSFMFQHNRAQEELSFLPKTFGIFEARTQKK
ncbi:DEAD-box ATP-dependent RNA helicase 25 [Smittium mucronatum]|uniref:ATP-dependent RNA helicase n=1 Tax=Smittium mucronatum TaxID=133383 RepID=A0A1R0H7U4_9FUNG|nr:DEAD-box ATP-dependent RNA helicase 25 [Smittium mucronatum]